MDELLDKNLIAELKDVMEADFVMLLDSYITESDKQFVSIKEAWQTKNIELLGRSAHTLKGSCGNIGASGMATLCMQLESKASDNALDGVDELLQELTMVHGNVLNAVGKLRANS